MLADSAIWDWWLRGIQGGVNCIRALSDDGPPMTPLNIAALRQIVADSLIILTKQESKEKQS